MAEQTVLLPSRMAIATHILRNPLRQVEHPARRLACAVEPWSRRGVDGQLLIQPNGHKTLVISSRITRPDNVDDVLVVSGDWMNGNSPYDLSAGHWLSPRPLKADDLSSEEWLARREHARESWVDQLVFRAEVREGGRLVSAGLRNPQIGALYALLAHWTVGNEPATIVMPTGTGKTETMIAMLVAARPACLLVVVPTDPLREQVAL